MQDQLSLGIRLRDDADFENWYLGDNQELIASLMTLLQASHWGYLLLWGVSGSGKSHLLQAATQKKSPHSFYLPLSEFINLSPDILENLDHYALICIDDIGCVVGDPAWEEALFHFFNRSQHSCAHLLFSVDSLATLAAIKLPDLRSRLASGITYQIKPLDDDQKLAALQLRAKRRGMSLNEEVGKYLLNHLSRDTTELFKVLEHLDTASLKAKHRLTIPFVKSVLS